MTIALRCKGCGQTLHVKDEHAGARIRCTKCRSVLAVPAVETDDEDAEEEELEEVPQPKKRRRDDDDEDEEDQMPESRRRKRSHREEEDVAPRRRTAKEAWAERSVRMNKDKDNGPGYWAGILGGLALMAVGVVWFCADVFWHYDIKGWAGMIPFILGVFSILRSLGILNAGE
jgi:DNA-directed RNA polymerase subunit RPC12/RpoP